MHLLVLIISLCGLLTGNVSNAWIFSTQTTTKTLAPTSSILQRSHTALAANSITSGDYSEKKTFKRFLQVELWRTPEMESIYPVLLAVETACRDINRLMRRISTDDLDGYHGATAEGQTGSINIQGESQKKLDVVANRIMKIALCCSGKVNIVASEEDDVPCMCSDVTHNNAFSNAEYAAVFDPLDGSSNVDSGLPTGTIFGIYRKTRLQPGANEETCKQRGRELVAAGYCLYSAATHLAITLRTGLHLFTLDDVTGEFYLTKSHLKMPSLAAKATQPILYSFNDANSMHWEPAVTSFLRDLKSHRVPSLQHLLTQTSQTEGAKEEAKTRKVSARYMGALVADLHNILLNGGIFGYPAQYTSSSSSATKRLSAGKLRLVYEASPLALVVEEAGGRASNGYSRILDLPVHNNVHQRTPLFLGDADLVSALEHYLSFYKAEVREGGGDGGGAEAGALVSTSDGLSYLSSADLL